MKIRKALKSDAAGMVALFEALDNETHYMAFEPGERKTSILQQQQRLASIQNGSASVLFIAEDTEAARIMGFVTGHSFRGRRNQHRVSVVLGIQQYYWRQGVGRSLLQALVDWSASHGKHRLELTVMEDNKAAHSLYLSLGFVEEGIRRSTVRLDDQYRNEIAMAKFL